jgi:hypothetical protein
MLKHPKGLERNGKAIKESKHWGIANEKDSIKNKRRCAWNVVFLGYG